MLNNWFYSHPTWQVALAVCLFLVAVPLVALLIFHRLVPWKWREEDTHMVGLSYALCGGVYAVMLAFVAVGTFETMDRSETIASDEANSLGSMAFDSAGLPRELGVQVREDIDQYIETVTRKEWPNQQVYHMEDRNFEEGWAQVRRLSGTLAVFEPATQGQATVKAEMERSVNELFAARRTRLLAAKAHLPGAVWQMLIFGLLLVNVYIFLFGPHRFKTHVAVTALTMLSIGLVITLIIALDYPFRGDVSVSSEAYTGVREVAEKVFARAESTPGDHAPSKEHEKEK